MSYPLETHGMSKRFGKTMALSNIDWRAQGGVAIGLVGRNGSGKTTLLRTATGLLLPTEGECRTLGKSVTELGESELARIGYVDQDAELLDWMSVEQHVRYVAAFQPRWDVALELRLLEAFELDPSKTVGGMSKGMRQRLAVLLALGHRPELVLLDEPVSSLDPQARETVLHLINERVIEDGATAIVSSHVLHDIEKIVDHLVCLEQGRIVEDAPLDALKERFSEWIVTSPGPELPSEFSEPFVLTREGNGRQVRLAVNAGERELALFRERYGVSVERRSLDLERIFPLLTRQEAPR